MKNTITIYVVNSTGGDDSYEKIGTADDMPWPVPGDRLHYKGKWCRILDRDIDYDDSTVTMIIE